MKGCFYEMIDYYKLKDPSQRTGYLRETLEEIASVTDLHVLSDLLKMLSIKLENKDVDVHDAESILAAINVRKKILLSDSYKNNMRKSDHEKNYASWEKENRKDYDNNYINSSRYEKQFTNWDTNESGGTTNTQTQTQDKTLTLSPTSVSSRRGTISIVLILTSIAVTTVMYTLLWIANIKG